MDKKHSPLNSSNFSSDDNNITNKLRRLRIQEALLLQSVQKSGRNIKEDVEFCNSSSYRELLKKVKDSYINIKNLYDEVKANTQSQELVADLGLYLNTYLLTTDLFLAFGFVLRVRGLYGDTRVLSTPDKGTSSVPNKMGLETLSDLRSI